MDAVSCNGQLIATINLLFAVAVLWRLALLLLAAPGIISLSAVLGDNLQQVAWCLDVTQPGFLMDISRV